MPTQVIWHHRRRRSQSVVALVVLALAGSVTALLWGAPYLALFLGGWAVTATVAHQRPKAYERSAHAPFWFRVLGVALLAWPVVLWLIKARPRGLFDTSSLMGSLIGGFAIGGVFIVLNWHDTRLLLSRVMIEMQPRMSARGAVLRPLYVLLVVPLEELAYRGLFAGQLRDVLPGLAGDIVAILVSSFFFVALDVASSWGPRSVRRRIVESAVLGALNAALFFATGSLLGPILAHYLYNAGQLALPPMNFFIHRRAQALTQDVLT